MTLANNWTLSMLVDHELIISQISGIQDKEICLKLSSIRKGKEMTSTRIKYILLGWVGESLGGKEGIKGGRRNL